MASSPTEPDYVKAWRAEYPGISRFAIERSILRGWQRKFSITKKFPYGHNWTHHFCAYTKEVTPNIIITPWFELMCWSFEKTCLIDRRKIINHIGSASSGKTDFAATFAVNMLSVWPEKTSVYCAAPYIKAAHSTVWARCMTRLNDIKKGNPKSFGKAYHNKSINRLIFQDLPQSGFIELVTIDDVGKLQGIKSVDPINGWFFLLCDEVALFKKKELLEVLGNVTKNSNFCCFTGCNFRSTEGLEGDMCRPEAMEYEDLNIEKDQDWPSAYKSHTWRFDGHLCPNIVEGKVIYPFLLKEDDRQDMEEIHGLDGPKYLEQIRSFPANSFTDFYVTTREKIRAAGGYDDCIYTEERSTRVAFCDPGLGGDPCKIGVFDFGNAFIPSLDGGYVNREVFRPVEPLSSLKVQKNLVATPEWIARVRAVAKSPILIEPNKGVSPEQQIAVQSAEFCQKHNVSYASFGFDGSMRASVVQEMVGVMGNEVHGLDYGGVATDRPGDLTSTKVVKGKTVPKTAGDMYTNFASEVYFMMGMIIQAQKFRGAELIPAAINQLCRRWWEYTGSKKKIQSKRGNNKDGDKKSYYYENGRSPDDADTLCGGLEMARRKGFFADISKDGRQERRPDTNIATQALVDSLKKRTTKPLRRGSKKPIRHGMM